MKNKYSLSETGLNLIKAYEGYRPIDRTLVSGQRVVGYGHRMAMDDRAISLTRSEAETVLREDLAAFEDMINETVHAPLSQSQYDALCSLAFNIGPKAFLESDVLRAINNGRLLDAAHGFDVWRKSEIDGKVYVVDALMRRRAAEKALFLKPDSGDLPASRVDLPPMQDEMMALAETGDGLPVFSRSDTAGIVNVAPYDIPAQRYELGRRREDGPTGVLTLSEIQAPSDESDWLADDVERTTIEPADILEEPLTALEGPSPIAVAAAQVSDRLDALIDEVRGVDTDSVTDDSIPLDAMSPDSERVQSKINVVPFRKRVEDPPQSPVFENPLQNIEDSMAGAEPAAETLVEMDVKEAMEGYDSLRKYIYYEATPVEQLQSEPGQAPYWIMLLVGAILMIGAGWALMTDMRLQIGPYGDLAGLSAAMIGIMLFMGASYHLLRTKWSPSSTLHAA